MHTIYQHTIYCNPTSNSLPYPEYFRGLPESEPKLSKFGWVKYTKFEATTPYITAHTPFYIVNKSKFRGQKLEESDLNIENHLPFGVCSFEKDNALFWTHCAKTYLMQMDLSLNAVAHYTQLIEDFKQSNANEPTPKHWLEFIEKEKTDAYNFKLQFKLALKHRKLKTGLKIHQQYIEHEKACFNALFELYTLYHAVGIKTVKDGISQSSSHLAVKDGINNFYAHGLEAMKNSFNYHIRREHAIPDENFSETELVKIRCQSLLATIIEFAHSDAQKIIYFSFFAKDCPAIESLKGIFSKEGTHDLMTTITKACATFRMHTFNY